MRGFVRTSLIALLAIPAARAAESPTFHFTKPRVELREQIRTIGIMPMEIADVVPEAQAAAARERYESLVIERLAAAGFKIVSPGEMRAVRDSLRATLGGLYDPMTGDPIPDKIKAYEEFADNEYDAKHKVDGYLRLAIGVRRARVSGGQARWDGLAENDTGQSTTASFFTGTGGDGFTPALSFFVALLDRQRKPVYTGAGGVTLLGYTRNTLASVQNLDVDPSMLLSDPRRDARAMSLALDALALEPDAPRSWTREPIPPLPVAAANAVGPLRIPRETLLAEHAKVVLAPLELGAIEQRDAAQTRYRSLLEKELTRLGFTVVGADSYGSLWHEEQIAAGGFFDSDTGRPRTDAISAARTRIAGALAEKYGSQAVVIPTIVTRTASFAAGVAKWDGASEVSTGDKSRLAAMFNPSAASSGEIDALSLEVRITDLAGRDLYESFGGVQLAARFQGGRFVPVPQSELFSDPKRDERATQVALEALAPPAAASKRR
jgi:hypothetical protein